MPLSFVFLFITVCSFAFELPYSVALCYPIFICWCSWSWHRKFSPEPIFHVVMLSSCVMYHLSWTDLPLYTCSPSKFWWCVLFTIVHVLLLPHISPFVSCFTLFSCAHVLFILPWHNLVFNLCHHVAILSRSLNLSLHPYLAISPCYIVLVQAYFVHACWHMMRPFLLFERPNAMPFLFKTDYFFSLDSFGFVHFTNAHVLFTTMLLYHDLVLIIFPYILSSWLMHGTSFSTPLLCSMVHVGRAWAVNSNC